MNAWCKRLGLSLFLTLGFTANYIHGQAPLVPLAPQQVIPPLDASPNPPLSVLLARPQTPPPATGTPRLNSCGYNCDSSLDWYGCGGFRSQWDFVFGSCRTFFGEPCIPRVPHPGLARSE